jgi:uncharacterized DUF497 family protein
MVIIEWDPSKAARNHRKHGVSFHEAASIVGDPVAITYDDPEHSVEERRVVTMGLSNAKRILIVAHADRALNVRIISARKTTLRERELYEEKD